jgi:hypothetical protein
LEAGAEACGMSVKLALIVDYPMTEAVALEIAKVAQVSVDDRVMAVVCQTVEGGLALYRLEDAEA